MQFAWLNASRLWLVTDKQTCEPKMVHRVVGEVVQHGIDVVVYRDKISSTVDRWQSAALVQEQCLRASIPFIVAHDLELALQLKAHAIHIGKAGQSIASIREALGESVAIGYSCHSVLEAKQVFFQGADYVFIGPVFASPEKLKFGAPLGTDVIPPGIALPGPVVFIGGMDETTIPQAMGQGAKRFAAIQALLTGHDPARRVKSIAELVAKQ